MERILSRTVGGRVILDLDIVKMVISDPKRQSAMIDAGTPMVSQERKTRYRRGERIVVGLRKVALCTRCTAVAWALGVEEGVRRPQDWLLLAADGGGALTSFVVLSLRCSGAS